MFARVKKAWPLSLRPGWLTGPIFDKELRVSSRRRRNYVLRVFYVLLLTLFVAIVWLTVAESGGNATFQQSRMAEAGKRIVRTIVLFQFIATQVLAIIMLSTAISDEIYHRTLGLLMTTPINSLQIVMGKVLSKLLQLIGLLCITLPMLAIVRVFGGVSWSYLLSSLFVTLTAVIFAGSVSLLFSVETWRAYGVVIRAVFALGVLYFILPAGAAALFAFVLPRFGLLASVDSGGLEWLAVALMHCNPIYGIWGATQQMLSPGSAPPFFWPVHCIIMLGCSALVLAAAIAVVRKAALRQATGQLDLSVDTRKGRRRRARLASQQADDLGGRVKRVHGPPVVWRELRAPFIQGLDNRNSYIGLMLAILALLLTYLPSADQMDESYPHVSYGLLFVLIGLIINVVFSATRITTEKESQTWPLLLTTPLRDRDILLGKGISAFRRCLPIWGMLAGHVLFFVLIKCIHPVIVLHLVIVVTWLTCFVTGAGLYFSTLFARTTSAVVATFALVLGLWAVVPVIVGLSSAVVRRADPLTAYLWTHPVIQTERLIAGAGGAQNANRSWGSLEYGTERVMFDDAHQAFGVGRMTGILTAIALGYISVGLLFFWRARCRLRRNVF